EVCNKVENYSIDHAPIMPTFAIPEEFGTEEGYRQKYSEEDLFNEFTRDENGNVVMEEGEAHKKIEKLGGYDKLYRIKLEADYLAKLAMDGAHKRYGEVLDEETETRLRFELHIMKTMGFPGYFLIVQDFIRAAREELDVSVGPGRGSAAGSAVAYCLGITQIDPIKYDLLFERFLNPDRISLPDIDIDFDDDGRGRVLNWVTQKYGKEKVAHIITYGTMATKMALKDVARVQKLPLAQANQLCKWIPDRINDPNDKDKQLKVNLQNAIMAVPELKAAEESTDPIMRDTIKYAKMLEGNVRGTGVHACGTIICRDDITDWVPVSTADDKETGEKMLVTQYEGAVIEDTGLIKMDFLGLKTLSIIKDAIENVEQTHGVKIDIDNIPIDDKKTYDLYCKGGTIGTFQFESPGMQKYLRELQPSTFEDLIAMNALYRPGPMDYIPDFIDRKHGRKPIVYDIPIMERYLKDTYGITVYQEQVMLLSRLLGNFTRGESDTLRKAMGKKIKSKLDELKPKFIAGGKSNGHDEKVLEKIWADWEKFASYAFNKSHATCYSWVAYQTAYVKAH
ncbi:MAG: DNA polymerase III subunit alpha, partial [Alistipes sp.]|nr:DNA polymerase III subunit alpha [Alistipes sp.]